MAIPSAPYTGEPLVVCRVDEPMLEAQATAFMDVQRQFVHLLALTPKEEKAWDEGEGINPLAYVGGLELRKKMGSIYGETRTRCMPQSMRQGLAASLHSPVSELGLLRLYNPDGSDYAEITESYDCPEDPRINIVGVATVRHQKHRFERITHMAETGEPLAFAERLVSRSFPSQETEEDFVRVTSHDYDIVVNGEDAEAKGALDAATTAIQHELQETGKIYGLPDNALEFRMYFDGLTAATAEPSLYLWALQKGGAFTLPPMTATLAQQILLDVQENLEPHLAMIRRGV